MSKKYNKIIKNFVIISTLPLLSFFPSLSPSTAEMEIEVGGNTVLDSHPKESLGNTCTCEWDNPNAQEHISGPQERKDITREKNTETTKDIPGLQERKDITGGKNTETTKDITDLQKEKDITGGKNTETTKDTINVVVYYSNFFGQSYPDRDGEIKKLFKRASEIYQKNEVPINIEFKPEIRKYENGDFQIPENGRQALLDNFKKSIKNGAHKNAAVVVYLTKSQDGRTRAITDVGISDPPGYAGSIISLGSDDEMNAIIIAHELGHAGGLAHHSDKNSCALMRENDATKNCKSISKEEKDILENTFSPFIGKSTQKELASAKKKDPNPNGPHGF